jgi:hypothetical protein
VTTRATIPPFFSRYSHLALRYRSVTRYGDGNPVPVIDAEMPNILRHLGRAKLL